MKKFLLGLILASSAVALMAQQSGYSLGGGAPLFLDLITDGAKRLTITPGGDVGVDTRSPNKGSRTRALTVESSSASGFPSIELVGNRTNADAVAVTALESYFWTNDSTHRLIGQVVFQADGTTAGQRGGAIRFLTKADASTTMTERGRWTAGGDWRVANLAGAGNRAVYSDPSGNLTNSASDGSLKEYIAPITDAVLKTRALRGVTFNWRDRTRRGPQRELGLVAQDVRAVVPEVVGANADGTLSVDYPKLTALLAEAIEELAVKVDKLEAKAAKRR